MLHLQIPSAFRAAHRLHAQDTHVLHAAELQEQRGHVRRLPKSDLLQGGRSGCAPVPNTAVRADRKASVGLRGFEANPSSFPRQHAEPSRDQHQPQKLSFPLANAARHQMPSTLMKQFSFHKGKN